MMETSPITLPNQKDQESLVVALLDKTMDHDSDTLGIETMSIPNFDSCYTNFPVHDDPIPYRPNTNYGEYALLQVMLECIHEYNRWVFFYEPVVEKYFSLLHSTIIHSILPNDGTSVIMDIMTTLCTILDAICVQTIITELNHARKNGLLEGDCPRTREEYFCTVLLRNERYCQTVYEKYPELTRIMDTKVRQFVTCVVKMFKDTEHELVAIEKSINNGRSLGNLKSVFMDGTEIGSGVIPLARLEFTCGKKIIYRWNGLFILNRFNAFLNWLNRSVIKETGKSLYLVRLHTLNDSGWMEYIENRPCQSAWEFKRLYHRMGTLQCVLNTLNTKAGRSEGIVVKREMPVLIDPEMIMHPDVCGGTETDTVYVNISPEFGAIDTEPANTPDHTEELDQYRELPVCDPGSGFEGEYLDPTRFRDNISAGFSMLYRWICDNKELYREMVQYCFGVAYVRVVYRSEDEYGRMLSGSYHPDLLSSQADRLVFLHRLTGNHSNDEYKRFFLEMHDLFDGDIPYFVARADKNRIYDMRNEDVELVLHKSTMESIRERIEAMDESDLLKLCTSSNTEGDSGARNGLVATS